MSIAIPIEHDQIAQFCQRNGIRKLSVFGSVLRDDFGPESDVDVLIAFQEGVEPGLDRLLALERELSELIGCPVDLGEEASVLADQNYIRRKAILGSAQIIYEK